jgi:hypothetical protein
MLFLQLKPADVACENATLRTSPSSGQATSSSLLSHPKHLACHSGAAFGGLDNGQLSLWSRQLGLVPDDDNSHSRVLQ